MLAQLILQERAEMANNKVTHTVQEVRGVLA